MRDYAKVAPQFWTGDTGRAIRKLGTDAQVIALYLLTCPSSNAIGLYYLPIPTLCHETGCPIKGASKALRSVCEVGFASYDEETEHVFVFRMAEYQIGEALNPHDKRVQWIKKELQAYKNTPFFNQFVERYKDVFHLHELEGLGRGFEAPSKPGAGAGAGTGKHSLSEAGAPDDMTGEFLEFYSAYPKHEDKRDAWKAWCALGSRRPPLPALLAAIERQKSGRKWQEGFIKAPASWLRKGSWEDEDDQPVAPVAAATSSFLATLDRLDAEKAAKAAARKEAQRAVAPLV